MELKLKNVTKKFMCKYALDNVTLDLEYGNIYALLGPKYSGKSTLINLISTLIKPSYGEILLDNTSIITNPEVIKPILGYLPEKVALYENLSALEFLNYMLNIRGFYNENSNKEIYTLLELVGMSEYANNRISTYSTGMKKKIGIACALLGNPQILLLDEPTSGLDNNELSNLKQLLIQLSKDKLIIVATEDVPFIDTLASQIIILNNGKTQYIGNCTNLIKLSQGKIWTYISKTNDLSNLPNNCIPLTKTQKTEGINVKLICEEKPLESAILQTPSLEDSYNYILLSKRTTSNV